MGWLPYGCFKEGYKFISISRTSVPPEGVIHIPADISHPDSIAYREEVILKIAEKIDQLVLLHNAGMINKHTIKDIDRGVLQKSFELSIMAPVILDTLLLKNIKPGSSIIYIGSTLSEKAVPNSASYVISKHAIVGLMRSSFQDLSGSGIHTACVCPGFAETEMLREYIVRNEDVLE